MPSRNQDSTLVEVAGVAADRRPGGASMRDVPLRTQAWVAQSRGAAAIDFTPQPGAPTEAVVFRCLTSLPGADCWLVQGAVSGTVGTAVTGAVFAAGPVSRALIPVTGDSGTVSGDTAWSYTPTARAPDETPPPSVCLLPVRLGVAARPGLSVNFVFKKRPDTACACLGKSVGPISNFLLGLEGSLMGDIDPALRSRAIALYDWRRVFFETHCGLGGTTTRGWWVKWLFSSNGYAPIIVTIDNTQFAKPDGVGKLNYSPFRREADADLVMAQLDEVLIDAHGADALLPCGISVPLDRVVSSLGPSSERLAVKSAYVAEDWGARTSTFDTDWLDQVVTLLGGCLQEIFTEATALAAWDGFFAEAQEQAAFLAAAGDDLALADDLGSLLKRQQAQMDVVRILGGILPKADASSGGGSAVWRDDPEATHWWVDESGRYLPAFSNKVYYSALRDSGSVSGTPGKIINLKEFAFGLVVPCDWLLKVNDRLAFSITGVTSAASGYREGDEIRVDVVGAAPAALAGGVVGSDTRIWHVEVSVSGTLASLSVPAGGSADYTAAGVSLALAEGGIPFVLGDAPSFVAGDRASFSVHQPYSPEGIRRYAEGGWQRDGAASVLTLDFGAPQPVSAVALAGHALPVGATLRVELSLDALLWQSVPVDSARRVALGFLPDVVAARYLRLTINAAPGGHLGWVWAGVPLTTQRQADSVRLRRNWALTHSSGFNPAAFCAGSGRGGDIAWSMLTHADAESLLTMIDYCQTHVDPLIFVPSHHFPDEAALVRVSADAIELDDWMQFQANDRLERAIALKLPLAAVLA